MPKSTRESGNFKKKNPKIYPPSKKLKKQLQNSSRNIPKNPKSLSASFIQTSPENYGNSLTNRQKLLPYSARKKYVTNMAYYRYVQQAIVTEYFFVLFHYVILKTLNERDLILHNSYNSDHRYFISTDLYYFYIDGKQFIPSKRNTRISAKLFV